jgi:hypothetical protein
MERRKDIKTREAVEEALQRRDIEDLTKEMREGFAGMHTRQDTTNGKVLKSMEDIIELKNDRSFIRGVLATIITVLLPTIFFVLKLIFER